SNRGDDRTGSRIANLQAWPIRIDNARRMVTVGSWKSGHHSGPLQSLLPEVVFKNAELLISRGVNADEIRRHEVTNPEVAFGNARGAEGGLRSEIVEAQDTAGVDDGDPRSVIRQRVE